ncbi:MAG: radical SAM protein, partial [Candidatus Eisenbacteria bacterium]
MSEHSSASNEPADRIEYREEPCRSALNRVTGMDFEWSLNPYMGCAHRCTFCYVRGFERRADRPGDERYGTSIRVKVNVAEVLRAELARASWRREYVLIGAATDPYQPIEGRYRLTRGCLAALADFRTPFGIITRGTLVVRDLDVLQRASQRAAVSVSFSVPTLDERVWRTTEPGTAHPRHRLRALRTLVAGGVRASVAIAPILPGLSDSPESLAAVVRAAREAGACGIWSAPLNLRDGTREHLLATLAREWHEELPRYEKLFAGRSYLPSSYGQEIFARVKALKLEHGIADRRAVRLVPPP